MRCWRAKQTGRTGVRIFVPPAAVIGTDVFDEFIAQAGVSALALSDASDETIDEAFLRSPLPAALEQDLLAIVERTRGPLAVRSSSLLEDSYDQPFAGIYGHVYAPERRSRRADAARRVGGGGEARLRLDVLEERQGVRCQHAPPARRGEDGGRGPGDRRAAAWALLLPFVRGRRVLAKLLPGPWLEGRGKVSPPWRWGSAGPLSGRESGALLARFAAQRPQFASMEGVLDSAQREFYALDLEHASTLREPGHADALVALSLETAERDGTLHQVGSVYSAATTRCTTGCRGRGFAS